MTLRADGVRVRFGGHVALNDVSLEAEPGRITGLIGPNGAGKTTFFNACTGLVDSAAGTVTLGDRRLDRLSPARRAAAGLGRTFQRMALFDTMTALENVSMGLECRLSARHWYGQLAGSRNDRRQCRDRAMATLERCGIADLAGSLAGNLSTGQRRLIEFSRAITSDFCFLLLDEPSSGLDEAETQQFAAILSDVVHEDRIGILIVEHDMTLVRQVCAKAYVLDFGTMIFEGTTADVMASDIVRAAYLGTEEVA